MKQFTSDSLISRRGFLVSGAAVSLAAGFPLRAAPRQPESTRFFSWEHAAPGIWVAFAPVGQPSLGGNSTLLTGARDAVLIDTKYPAIAAALRREASSFGMPLAAVINTHHHADHTGGNLAFSPDLPVLAHKATASRIPAQMKRYVDGIPGMVTSLAKMEGDAARAVTLEAQDLAGRVADLKAEQFSPTRAIELDTDLDFGDVKVRAAHFGPAHTDNDIAIHVAQANVLVAGDLVFHSLHPVIDRGAGGTAAGWIKALASLDALCDDKTVVVPGHGALGGRDVIRRQSEYLQALLTLAARAVEEGTTRDDALKLPVPAPYAEYGQPQRFPATFGAIYDEAVEAAEAAGAVPGRSK